MDDIDKSVPEKFYVFLILGAGVTDVHVWG